MNSLMTPLPHQKKVCREGVSIINEHGCVYLAMQERTGKTLSAIMIAEELNATKVLVITLKKAVSGWVDTFERYVVKGKYTIINYEILGRIEGTYDIVILDEAHSKLGSIPTFTKTHDNIKAIVGEARVIYISATPHAQGLHMLFPQLHICSHHKWSRYKDYFEWHRVYSGLVPYPKRSVFYSLGGYNPQGAELLKRVVRGRVERDYLHLMIVMTRRDVGFTVEPEDKLHYVDLSPPQLDIYNRMASPLREVTVGGHTYIPSNKATQNILLHMIEGGTISQKAIPSGVAREIEQKMWQALESGEEYTPPEMKERAIVNSFPLEAQSKIQYILDTFGDTEDMVIMYHFVAEKPLLEKYFKKAKVLSGATHAMGITITEPTLIIYSQSYSTAHYIQRRARQTGKHRTDAITVHFILTQNAPSDTVYRCVGRNNKNYTARLYNYKELQ